MVGRIRAGLGPGVTATALGAVISTYFWIPPAFTLIQVLDGERHVLTIAAQRGFNGIVIEDVETVQDMVQASGRLALRPNVDRVLAKPPQLQELRIARASCAPGREALSAGDVRRHVERSRATRMRSPGDE
jgi:hypothetical protein